MKDNVVSSIWVATQLDTSQFKKSLREVDQELQLSMKKFDNYEKTTYSTSRTFDAMGDSAQSLRQSMGEVGDSAQKASNGMDKFGEAVETADKPLDELNDDLKETSEGMKDVGEHTQKTTSKMDEFEGFITGKLTKALSVAGLAGVLIGVSHELVNLQDEAVQTANNFRVLYDGINSASKAYGQFESAKNYLKGGTDEQKTAIVKAVNLEFKGLEASYKQNLQQEILSISGALGLNGEQLAYDLSEIQSKWNISNDKLIETLQTLKNVALEQTGDKYTNFTENIRALKEFDKPYQAAGFDFDKLLAFFQTIDSKAYNKGVGATSELINKEFLKGMGEISSAQSKTQQYEALLTKAISERDNYAKELERLSGNQTSEKIDSKVESLVSKITDLNTKIKEISDNLVEAKSLAGMSSADMMKNILEKDVLKTGDLSMKGGDLEGFVEVAQIMKDILKNQSSTDILHRGSGNVTEIQESFKNIWDKTWEEFRSTIGKELADAPEYRQYKADLETARKEQAETLMELAKLSLNLTDKDISSYMKEPGGYNKYPELFEFTQNYGGEGRRTAINQGNIELIQEYTEQMKNDIQTIKEKSSDRIQLDVNVKTDTSFITATASLRNDRGNQSSLVW